MLNALMSDGTVFVLVGFLIIVALYAGVQALIDDIWWEHQMNIADRELERGNGSR